jgi:triosephosphate isomerase
MERRKFVVGNWKMFGTAAELPEIKAIAQGSSLHPAVDVALCVPATLIDRATQAAPGFRIGAQDIHFSQWGAHTGCVCAEMLLDAGANLAIAGHSERREAQRESNEEVRAKAEAALAAGLDVIVCVGESLEQRSAGLAARTVEEQLTASLPPKLAESAELAIAYEPIWAIGTGQTASPDDIQQMHKLIRERLTEAYGAGIADQTRILYGGSVKPTNAAEIFACADVDGALVGGASLKAVDFLPIVEAAALANG